MDNPTEVREFLTSRRARLHPEEVGIASGGRRRVSGLRREEVALLAGVSFDYYVRMERGNLNGVSTEILDAVARTLRLTDAETDHLHNLASAAGPARRKPSRPAETVVRPTLQRILDAITGAPAWITNARFDTLASNALGRALLAPVLRNSALEGNGARFIFLDPAAHNYYPDWERAADTAVASMRQAAGRTPHDRNLTDLIGELIARSTEFERRWARHDVRVHRSGHKHIVHPDCGDLEFMFELISLPDTPDWALTVFTAAEGSPTHERLSLLGSLAATLDAEGAARP